MTGANAVVDWFGAPLAYGFMQRGLIASTRVGILCAVVGCYVVLRSMAFLGDAMAHAILPGVAVAYLLKGNLILGALVAAIALGLLDSFVVSFDPMFGGFTLYLGMALILLVRPSGLFGTASDRL